MTFTDPEFEITAGDLVITGPATFEYDWSDHFDRDIGGVDGPAIDYCYLVHVGPASLGITREKLWEQMTTAERTMLVRWEDIHRDRLQVELAEAA